MNKYVFVLIVCAVVFLVCFLIDSLLKLLFPKSRLEKSKQVVRPPRRSAVIGVILTFAGAAMLVKLLPEKGDLLFILGSIVAVIFGVILLCTYFSFVIYYDDEGFLYKAWGHGKQEFRYSQIRGQRSLLTRGGVNTILFVGEEEINLYSAMQNLNAFLSKAFFKWCAAKGIDPDSVENNPRMATYFPDPDCTVFVFPRGLFHRDQAIRPDGDGHAVLDIGQEVLAEGIDDRHLAGLEPDVGENGAGCRQRVDGVGEQHARRLPVHRARAVEDEAARGRADGLRQAERLAGHGLAVEVGVILVAAFGRLVAELERFLERGQRIESAVRHERFGLRAAGRDDTALEGLHACLPPFVILARISSSV